MIETLWRTISRSAPATSTPALNATLTAARIAEQDEGDDDRQHREERARLAALEVAPDERQELHAAGSSTSTPLSRWSDARRARRGVRVVRDHDDRLAVLAVERLQQVEDLVARLAVEVAGRLVAEQQRRVGDDGARDADALLLAAGELARVVLARGRSSPTTASAVATCSRRSRALTAASAAAAARRCARRSAPAAGCRSGRRSRRGARARRPACASDSSSMRSPPTSTAPAVGRSRPPIRLSSVDLPEPDGPISARNSPCADLEAQALRARGSPRRRGGRPCARSRTVDQCVRRPALLMSPSASPASAPSHLACRPPGPAGPSTTTRSPRGEARARSPPRRPVAATVTARPPGAPLARTDHDTRSLRRRPRAPPRAGTASAAPPRRPPPPARRARKATFTPMSGRMRGSSCVEADAHLAPSPSAGRPSG